jgi:poly(A) polymerase
MAQVRDEQRARQQGPAGGAARAQGGRAGHRACGRRPAGAAGADGADGDAAASKKRRRRRRRKPAGGGEAGTGSDLA